MYSLEMIRTLVEYDIATWRRVWASIETLTPEQWAQELPYSHGSIRNQMVHITRATLGWSMGLRGEPGGQQFRLDPNDFPTPAVTRARWEEAMAGLTAIVNSLSEEALGDTLPEMMGPTWHILLHLVNHGTDHRAQVLSGLNQLGAPTLAQDLIFYLWFTPR